MAANLSRIVIVAAPFPRSSIDLLDPCLVAAETADITPIVLLNKIDSVAGVERRDLEEYFALYETIGYGILSVSARLGTGLERLQAELAGHTSILVGQSGVGKSSLVKALFPDLEITIGAVSPLSGLGTHTTSTSRLYHLPGGGDLVDSPGVREFGLWPASCQDIAGGFREFRPYLGRCRFSDCTHSIEPDCAILQAVWEGKIHKRRLASYRKILGVQVHAV